MAYTDEFSLGLVERLEAAADQLDYGRKAWKLPPSSHASDLRVSAKAIRHLALAMEVCEEAARFCEEINEDTGECDLDRLPRLHEALDKYEALVEQAEAARLAEGE